MRKQTLTICLALLVLPIITLAYSNNTGLISEYRFENTTADSKGINNGSLVGSLTYSQGILGWSVNNFTSSNYINVTDSDSLDFPSNALTFCAWTNKTLNSNRQTILFKNNGTASTGLSYLWETFYHTSSNYTLQLGLATGTGSAKNETRSAANTLNSVAWLFLCTTWDQTTSKMSLYINGTEMAYLSGSVQNKSDAVVANAYPLYIGNSRADTTRFIAGSLDELTLWNRSLTATEILQMYNDYLALS